MAARLSAKRLPRYSLAFKRSAVRLTKIPGIEVQVVAWALDIHPVMLSRWRQEVREGRLRGVTAKPPEVKTSSTSELWNTPKMGPLNDALQLTHG
ncbi:MAG: hypothetical protein DMF83_21370 [Acidobacteria bacterium]|nr:MAG: hypothetical protein DMF83_21370 [Acidobacteriota bacterium]